MNSRERFLAALAGEKPDRTPVAHVAVVTSVELQKATGCYMPDVHHDARQQVRLLSANHEVLGLDAITFPINFFNEPAALGAAMDWGTPTQLPTFRSDPWRRAEDAVIPDDLLDRPPVSTAVECLRIAKRDFGDRVAVLGKVMGPLSMTQAMHGIEQTMIGLIDERELISHFLEVCVEAIVLCANTQLENGSDAVVIGEGGAGANMLSPAMYEEILLPVHQRMLDRIHGPTIMHICGDVTARLSLFKQTAMTCFNFDWAIPPKRMVEAAGGAYRVMGNINTGDLLHGTPQDIERQVIENLEAGVDIISPGCAISPNCPNANLRAMVDAVTAYYPGRGLR